MPANWMICYLLKNIKKLLAAKLLLIVASVYTGFLTLTSLIKIGKISVGEFNPTDKLLHFAAYFGLVLIWQLYFIFREDKIGKFKPNLFKVLLGSLAFGIFIEVLQGLFTTYRTPDWNDVLANSFGAGTAAILFFVFKNNLQRLKTKINLIF